jgi:hypothetical protein
MNPQALPFIVAAAFGLVVWGLVVRRYVWPWMNVRSLRDAVEPVLYLHAFRFIGLAFIAPGVVGSGLDMTWARDAALGDVGAAVLALGALALIRTRAFPLALWAFNLWGSFDLLRAAALGPVYDVPPHLNATFFIPVVGVPLLAWTHVAVFARLLRQRA